MVQKNPNELLWPTQLFPKVDLDGWLSLTSSIILCCGTLQSLWASAQAFINPMQKTELVCLRAILGSCFWTGWRLRWALWWCLGPSCWERHLWWWSRKKTTWPWFLWHWVDHLAFLSRSRNFSLLTPQDCVVIRNKEKQYLGEIIIKSWEWWLGLSRGSHKETDMGIMKCKALYSFAFTFLNLLLLILQYWKKCLGALVLYLFYLFDCAGSYSMWDIVPWPGIKPGPPALGAQRFSDWPTREVCWKHFCQLLYFA